MSATGPLAGVRVLDLTRIVAGPTCTQLLGDYGAEIIKIEHPGTNGDKVRRGLLRYVHNKNVKDSISSSFMGLNRNKKSIAINFHKQKGSQIIRNLVATKKFKVFIENYKNKDLQRFGLSYESLSKLYPDLIYCSITIFGKTSAEYDGKKGYNLVAEGLSGLININGGRRYTVPITDLLSGYLAFGAISSALYANKGQHLNVSLYDTALAALTTGISSTYLYANKQPVYTGNQHLFLVPNGVYDTKDGQIVLGVYSEEEWPILCNVLGGDIKDKLFNDKRKRFDNVMGRFVNRKLFNQIFESYLKTQTTKYWIHSIENDEIAKKMLIYSDVQKVSDALNHRFTKYNKMVIDMPYNSINGSSSSTVKTVGFPIKMSVTKPSIRYGVPQFAQHSKQILTEYLHFDDAKIKLFEKEGIIKTFNIIIIPSKI